jgi:hypothetical protein
MRVIFRPGAIVAGSFFPGLAKSVVIESDLLTEGEKRELEDLVQEAKFFELPVRVSTYPVSSVSNAPECTITIDCVEKRHTVAIVGPLIGAQFDAVRRLVNLLERKAREKRAREPEIRQ